MRRLKILRKKPVTSIDMRLIISMTFVMQCSYIKYKYKYLCIELKQVLKKTNKENKEPYYQSVRRYCTAIPTWVDEFNQFIEKEKHNDTTLPSNNHRQSLINGFRPHDPPKSFYKLKDLDTIDVRFVWYFTCNLESQITKEFHTRVNFFFQSRLKNHMITSFIN
ncbi:hypothetical protein WN944_007192 [Citrus x changshan-huyou]|uniref:Uncharacterized protein n=1 Tax=Citrus x changshan-huyou TaxID=2935761 RepID=A0AAP0QUK0_9ROSI